MLNHYLHLLAGILLVVLVTACDDDAHEGEYPLSPGQGALVIGLESGAEVTDLTLYLFGSDGTAVLCETYGIQKGRGIFADARPYYVVVSRRCHSTRYQFQLTTEGEHQKRILLDGNIRVLICRKFDSLSAASLYRLQLVEQYWNTYYNNFFRYESRARSEFEEELKCDGIEEKKIGSSI